MIRRLKEAIASDSNSLSTLSLKAFLWCASRPYAAGVWFRNLAFDRGLKRINQAGVPVVSVGNLTAGGTGKTPTVAWLAKWFRDREVRVAILSRGYGSGSDGLNDEAKELEVVLPDVPHLQSPDRTSMARIAVDELEMQVLVLDDGFQHRKIHRDLEVVLLDAREPFGYGHLLPRGLLREPISSLKRADIVIATRSDQVDAQALATIRSKVQRHNPKAAWLESRHRPVRLRNSIGEVRELEWLKNKRVFVVCAIGNPDAFLDTVKSTGVELIGSAIYPDHYIFVASDMRDIAERATKAKHADAPASTLACDAIVCTGKDLAKIDVPALDSVPIWSIDIELEVTSGQSALEDRLERIAQEARRNSEWGDDSGPNQST